MAGVVTATGALVVAGDAVVAGAEVVAAYLYHWLRFVLSFFTQTSTESTGEQNDFHNKE